MEEIYSQHLLHILDYLNSLVDPLVEAAHALREERQALFYRLIALSDAAEHYAGTLAGILRELQASEVLKEELPF